MDIRPLLNRRPLEPGESLPSLAARLQAANHYRSPTAIATICHQYLPAPGDNIYLPGRTETWRVLAAVTRLPASLLYQATFHRYAAALALPWETPESVTLPDGEPVALLPLWMQRIFLRPLQDAQFCPLCLADGRYHRVNWLNVLVAMCPDHQCLMQRGCPNCHQKLSVPAIVGAICAACQCHLTASPVISVRHDAWGVFAQQLLQSWWGDTTPPPLPNQATGLCQPIPILLEVLRVLAQAAAKLPDEVAHLLPFSAPPLPRPTPPEQPQPAQVYRDYATVMQVVAQWPQAFHRFLAVYRQRPGVAVGQVTDEFDPLYLAWLEKRWQRPEFAFIQEAFDDFLVTNYPLSRSVTRLDRYQRSQALRDRFPYLTQAEAAERLNIEVQLVQRLVKVGILVDYEQGEGRQRHWHQRIRIVRRIEFARLQQQWREGVPVDDVAQLLGVERQIVKELVHAGMLEQCCHASSLDDTLGRIELISFNTFVNKLQRYPVIPYDLGETVTLQELVQNGYGLVSVLQQVLANNITAVWLSGGLPNLWLSQDGLSLLQK